jgi:hypothetical protein
MICHGRRGEIRKRYSWGQKAPIGALNLVTNTVVLRNTMHMKHALSHFKQTRLPISGNNIAGLWPLRDEYVTVHGNNSFSLSKSIGQGKHQPLNQLDNA